MQVLGKQVKDYVLGEVIASYQNMHLLAARSTKARDVAILMIDKTQIDNSTFVGYLNILQENPNKVHPLYIEPVQSSNNIYIVLENIKKLEDAPLPYLETLACLVDLYRRIGEYKVQLGELFVNAARKIVYLPFYTNVRTSSKFYAQFHNKSILGEVFARVAPGLQPNKALEIFIQNIDTQHPYEAISQLVAAEGKSKVQPTATKGYPTVALGYPTVTKENSQYPSLSDEEKDDEQILRLMSEAKDLGMDKGMQQEAAMFQRQSVRHFQDESDKELSNIMEMAKSSMHIIKKANKSSQFRTKMEVKISQSKMQGDQFDLYFNSYYESLRFLKKSLRVFLQYYKGGFAGIVASYLIATTLTLRKAYMIKDLNSGIDIFQLDIDMVNIKVKKYVQLIAHEMRNQARMVVELRMLLESCQMPYKTFSTLAPFLEEDISLIDLEQLQSFSFYFLSALMKGRQKSKTHFLYFIETMYLLLHRNYEVVFFQSDFPGKWDQGYFSVKVSLIQAILPGWSLAE